MDTIVTATLVVTNIDLQGDAIGRLVVNAAGGPLPGTSPNSSSGVTSPGARDPRSLGSPTTGASNIEITQVFNERVDTRAAAADIAWQLT